MEDKNINTQEYWNDNYSKGFYQDNILVDRKLWQDFIDFALPINHLDILEVACGLGYNAVYAAEKKNNVVAIDFSKVAIDENRKRFSEIENLNFIVMNINEATALYKFDAIMAFEILEHFKNPMPIIRKLQKCLKPDGILIFSVPEESGKFGYFEQHYSLWNFKSTTERMFLCFKSVEFYKNAAYGHNILGIARGRKE